MRDSKIDILAINESKLDNAINNHEVYIPGYEIVWRDRQINGRKGGGVCFYLRSNLNFKVLAPSLAFLFNQSISSGIVPTEWKLARVTTIFKKGKRQDVNNYRPISIIPTVAKVPVFEKIIYDQFFKYLN